MHVIVVNDYGSVSGGADHVAITSVNALADAGIDVTFVSSVAPVASSIDETKVRIINFGFEDLISNPSRSIAAVNGLWDIRCAKRFGEVLDNYDITNTIIHFHTWVKSLSASVLNESIRRGFKHVVTLHDYFLVCPNGGFYNYSTKTHCGIHPLSLKCTLTNCDSRNFYYKIWRSSRHFIQNKVANLPSKINNFITVSEYSENILKPYLPHEANFFRVRNSIDIDKVPPSSKLSTNKFTFVGRLSPEKGPVLFAKAAKNANVEAIFVGQGPESDAIREANNDAKLVGWMDRSAVRSYIRGSSAIVFPSIWHETQGLVVSEAAALGVPSIVSDGCAAKCSIKDGVTGLCFKSNDVEDLTKKIFQLKDDPQMAFQLGRQAYDKYWSNPATIYTHVEDLINCYKIILSG